MTEKKKDFLFILIFGLVGFLLPTITGLILAFSLKRTVFLESLYIIFGALTLIVALYRSRKRDIANYGGASKKEQSEVEKENAKQFRITQIFLYGLGLFLFLCSLISFLIGKYALGF